MASDQPVVSVILPFYNAPYLRPAIESILAQSYTSLELILIDNGSTDSSTRVAQSFLSDSRVTYITELRRGVVHAANAGIRVARAKYIARMDSDDVSTKDRIKRQVKFLEDNEDIAVVGGIVSVLDEENKGGFEHYIRWSNQVVSSQEIHLAQFIEFPMVNPSLMVRKTIYDHYGTYVEGDFPEDYEFFLRLQSHRVPMAKVEHHVLQWRDTDARLTRTHSSYHIDAFYTIKSHYLALWLQRNNPHHPHVWIWGAGRVSRKRSALLRNQGIEIEKYIDVKRGHNIVHFSELPTGTNRPFIISYVANRGARLEIKNYLTDRGYLEGIHFILAS